MRVVNCLLDKAVRDFVGILMVESSLIFYFVLYNIGSRGQYVARPLIVTSMEGKRLGGSFDHNLEAITIAKDKVVGALKAGGLASVRS